MIYETTCNSKQVSYRAHSKRSNGSTRTHETSYSNNMSKTATRHIARKPKQYARAPQHNNKRHVHDVQVKHYKT